jgi:anti-sigma regulatory factor (Ser/Thr protein kinase)
MCETVTRTATGAQPLTCSRTYPARADQVREARRFLASFLAGRPAADNAVLCLSELAANAVLHSDSGKPGGQFIVRAQIHDGLLRVEVHDQGGHWEPRAHGTQHGRGLLIVSQLARDWDISGNSHPGRTAWFELDCQDLPAGRPE